MPEPKGIRILAPIVGVRRKKDEEAEKDITKQNERVLLGFRNAYVFDVSQTNGVDLPDLHEVSGDPGENIDRLAAFLKRKGIQLVYNPNIAPALGMSYGGRIAILPGQSKAEEFSTLVHETAHELLHKAERRTATTKTVRETEAEAVAFVVGKAVGLVTGTHPLITSTLPRQRFPVGRELGSHSADRQCHPFRAGTACASSCAETEFRGTGTSGHSSLKTNRQCSRKAGRRKHSRLPEPGGRETPSGFSPAPSSSRPAPARWLRIGAKLCLAGGRCPHEAA